MDGMLPAPNACALLVNNAKMTQAMMSAEVGLPPRLDEAIFKGCDNTARNLRGVLGGVRGGERGGEGLTARAWGWKYFRVTFAMLRGIVGQYGALIKVP